MAQNGNSPPPFDPEDIVSWAESDYGFYLPDASFSRGRPHPGPVRFGEHQARILRHVFTKDENGRFPYDTVVYSCPKKSGKTTIGAVVTEWFGTTQESPNEIFVVANDRDQAQSRGYRKVRYSVEAKKRRGSVRAEVGVRKIVYSTGSEILALSSDYGSEAGGNHGLATFDELWAYCVSEDTEALTRDRGWVGYADLALGDEIATINDAGHLEWQPIEELSAWHHAGEMLRLKHRRCDMLVTPNHRVYGRFRPSGNTPLDQQPWTTVRADECPNIYEGHVRVGAAWNGKRLQTITVPERRTSNSYWPAKEYPATPFMAFLGYYLAEGCVQFKDDRWPGAVYIAQNCEKNPGTHAEIGKCLALLGLEPVTRPGGWIVYNAQLAAYCAKLGKAHEKYVPPDLKNAHVDQLGVLLQAYLDGDGWPAGKGYQFLTVSWRLADDMVEIAIKCGYVARYMKVIPARNENSRDLLRVSLSRGSIMWQGKQWHTEQYEGAVWCPTVKNNVFLARRNGFVYWTGNTSEASQRLWDELTPVPTRVNSVRFITTYAGFEGESELLWSLYEAGVGPEEFKEGRGERIPELSDLPCWRNGRLFVYWDHELRPHPGLTISPDDYHAAQKATSLRASAYIRLHENRWTSGAESFIDLSKWDKCIDPAMRPRQIDRKTLYWLHVDVAPKHDSSAVVGVRYNLEQGRVELGFHRIWQPSAQDPLDLEHTIEAYLMEAKRRYQILGISWDPYQFHRSATTLESRGLPMVEFPQTVPNLTVASQQLYDLIYNKNIAMYPSDELRLQASRAVAIEKTRGWKIAKEKTTHKIDAIVALAAACYFIITEGAYDVSEPIKVSAQFSDDLAVDGVRILREQEALLPPEFRSVV